MREAELARLEAARVQVGRVARIRAKCNVIVPKGAYQSPNFTGMPGGSGDPCGLDGSKRECEKLLAELQHATVRMRQLIRQAERIIARSGFREDKMEFCRAYYLRRMNVEEAAKEAGVSERSGWRYKAELEHIKKSKKTR